MADNFTHMNSNGDSNQNNNKTSSHDDKINSNIATEISPKQRYLRFNDLISQSKNSIQSSFKAFDTKNGIEVVWHTINLNSLDESEQSRVTKCVNIVKKIQNKYIIEYQSSWFKNENRTLNIITTHLEPLKEFIGKVRTLRWRIVKKWSKQILRGLECLHSSTPKIVHRNLTWSHIYINGGTSHTNIGDLWMAAVLTDDDSAPLGLSHALTSAAYMAPETALTTKLDIYSFGMCVLEMITREKPYNEFRGCFEVIREKARSGVLPRALEKVMHHSSAYDFIKTCLLPLEQRPSASDLLQHEFITIGPDDDEEIFVDTLETTNSFTVSPDGRQTVHEPSETPVQSQSAAVAAKTCYDTTDAVESNNDVQLSRNERLVSDASILTYIPVVGNPSDNWGESTPSPHSQQVTAAVAPLNATAGAKADDLVTKVVDSLDDLNANKTIHSSFTFPPSSSSSSSSSSSASSSTREQFCLLSTDSVYGDNTFDNNSSSSSNSSSLFSSTAELSNSNRSSYQNLNQPPLSAPSPPSAALTGPTAGIAAAATASQIAGHISQIPSSSSSSSHVSDKLGKELADFEEGENVDMDKGVHDGRSFLDDEGNPDDSADRNSGPQPAAACLMASPATPAAAAAVVGSNTTSASAVASLTSLGASNAQSYYNKQAPTQSSAESSEHQTHADTAAVTKVTMSSISSDDSDANIGSCAKLQLAIKIPARQTKEGTADQEIEFEFDPFSENIEAVAKEMVDELGVRMSVEVLAKKIEMVADIAIASSRRSSMARKGSVTDSPLAAGDKIAAALNGGDSTAAAVTSVITANASVSANRSRSSSDTPRSLEDQPQQARIVRTDSMTSSRSTRADSNLSTISKPPSFTDAADACVATTNLGDKVTVGAAVSDSPQLSSRCESISATSSASVASQSAAAAAVANSESRMKSQVSASSSHTRSAANSLSPSRKSDLPPTVPVVTFTSTTDTVTTGKTLALAPTPAKTVSNANSPARASNTAAPPMSTSTCALVFPCTIPASPVSAAAAAAAGGGGGGVISQLSGHPADRPVAQPTSLSLLHSASGSNTCIDPVAQSDAPDATSTATGAVDNTLLNLAIPPNPTASPGPHLLETARVGHDFLCHNIPLPLPLSRNISAASDTNASTNAFASKSNASPPSLSPNKAPQSYPTTTAVPSATTSIVADGVNAASSSCSIFRELPLSAPAASAFQVPAAPPLQHTNSFGQNSSSHSILSSSSSYSARNNRSLSAHTLGAAVATGNGSSHSLSLSLSVSQHTTATSSHLHAVLGSSNGTGTEPLTDDQETLLQNELEKIEKESRAARRAFEQRIQKHKGIMQALEEDVLKLEADFNCKISELTKKEEAIVRRKEEELNKAQLDFNAKIKEYNDMKRTQRVGGGSSILTPSPSTTTTATTGTVPLAAK